MGTKIAQKSSPFSIKNFNLSTICADTEFLPIIREALKLKVVDALAKG